ncbi:MAG: leucine-rich repeat domain-containing protein, partial [Chlamydiota bacterium]
MECNHEYISLFFQETEKDFNWLDEKCIKANGLEKTYIERKCLETKETKGWPVAPYIEKERVLVVSPMPHEELVLCSKKPVSTIFFPPVSRLLRFLKNLKIYLYHSKIPESIGRFYALERLTCKIQRVKTRFPIEAISSLPVLSYLRLNGTGIRDLGDVLKPLQFLKTLDLRNNLLRDISSPFHPRAELSRCDFSHNQIKRICFGGADQIQDLDLSHNLLGDLGDTLKPLQFLKILDLSNNLLRDISSPFHPMAGLSRCNFSHNQIEKIRFGGADQIQDLDLSHNLLGDLGDTLKPLQFLKI